MIMHNLHGFFKSLVPTLKTEFPDLDLEFEERECAFVFDSADESDLEIQNRILKLSGQNDVDVVCYQCRLIYIDPVYRMSISIIETAF